MRQGSRAEDVYEVLRRQPYGLLEGDLVRIECLVLPDCPAGPGDAGGDGSGGRPAWHWRPVRKEEPVGPGNSVMLVLTNRRTAWQAAARQHGGGGGGGGPG